MAQLPPGSKNSFEYSAKGEALTEQFEGLELEAYQDIAGIWTIGYGHTGTEVRAGYKITIEQAAALLETDVHTAVVTVNRLVSVVINQNQFDALVDFTFNVGCGAFTTSHLLELLNESAYDAAALQFSRWVHAGAKTPEGLIRRRAAETALFQEP